jgi:hypothetical protein
MTTDVFVITYPPDHKWLPYLWRSIAKHITGMRAVVLVLEQGDPEPPDLPAYVQVKRCPRYTQEGPGRNFCQPMEKLRAHEYTDANMICYMDSDCVFTTPLDLSTYRHPLIVEDWFHVGNAICWLSPTRQLLRFEPPYETMRRFPFFYPRSFIKEVWEHIGSAEGIARERAKGLTAVAEFNILGNYAVVKRPELFEILVARVNQLPELVIRQFWSHGGITPEVLKEMRQLGLAEEVQP